jgi:tetratricopeptide (TPR) repeat protein
MIGDIAIYDPRRLSESDFLAGFVARLDIYEFLIRQFQNLREDDVATHRLIVGQRGMGKTTLLRRIAIGIEEDAGLRECFTGLTFREEQYDVRSLAQLWRNCSEALAEWLEARGRAGEAAEIDRRLASERFDDGDAAWEQFAALCGQTKRRPVLFLDNINLILGALPESEGWKLRKILQARGGPVVFGASAAFLEETVNPKAPFYEFFQVHALEPLSVAEMRICLARIAKRRGEPGKRVSAILGSAPERVPVLHTMTGGNPRTLAFIYRLLESEREGDAQRDLETLLDDVTGLYKARVEELPEQARAVFDAIALHWDPASTALLVETTMLEPTTLSPQLNRLVERGFVEKTERADGKSGWQVAERFFNIWYLMRHGNRRVRQRLRWLTAFLTSFYSHDELMRLGRDLAIRAVTSPTQAHYFFAVSEAVFAASPSVEGYFLKRALTKRASTSLLSLDRAEIEKIVPVDDLDADSRELDTISRAIRNARSWPFEQADEFFRLLRLSGRPRKEQQQIVAQLPNMPPIEFDDLLKSLRSNNEARLKDQFPPEVVEAVERAVSSGALRDSSDTFNAETAAAMAVRPEVGHMILLWVALSEYNAVFISRHVDSISAAMNSCCAARTARATFRLALLLHVGLKRDNEAEAKYREAIGLDPTDAYTWIGLGELLQGPLARYDEAEAAYREAIRFNPTFALTWSNLGNLLTERSVKYDEAEAAYREAIRINPALSHPWNGLGNLLHNRLGRYVEAEAAYREAIRIDPASAFAWNNLGNLLQERLSRYDEAESAYRKAIRIDAALFHPWNGLGNLLTEHLARYGEAEAAFREAIRLNPAHALPWCGLGNLLQNRLARYDEAEAAYKQAIRIDPAHVASWARLGILLAQHFTHYDEAETAVREAIRISPTLDVYNPLLAILWTLLGYLLANCLDRYSEAEAAYREAIRIDPTSAHPWIGLSALMAGQLARYEEAEAACAQAIRISPNAEYVWSQLGDLRADHRRDYVSAREAYGKAQQAGATPEAQANLLWLELTEGHLEAARSLRVSIASPPSNKQPLPVKQLQLIDSGIALAAGHVDEALQHVEAVYRMGGVSPEYFDTLLRLLRLFAKHGAGERLLAWLDETGLGQQIAPVRAAFDAYLHDERELLNVNPETRGAAERIYRWLTSNRPREQGPIWPGPGTSELDGAKKRRKRRGRRA